MPYEDHELINDSINTSEALEAALRQDEGIQCRRAGASRFLSLWYRPYP